MEFTTVVNVQNFLGKDSLTAQESTTIEMLISMVGGIINNYCGWNILSKDYDRVVDGSGSTSMDLGAFPINTVASCIVGDLDYTAEVAIDAENGEIYFPTSTSLSFGSATKSVVVEYNAGFTEVPPELNYAACVLTTINYNRIVQKNLGVIKEQFTEVSAEYGANDIPELVQNVLDRYKKIGIH
jgi:hypothetical protein